MWESKSVWKLPVKITKEIYLNWETLLFDMQPHRYTWQALIGQPGATSNRIWMHEQFRPPSVKVLWNTCPEPGTLHVSPGWAIRPILQRRCCWHHKYRWRNQCGNRLTYQDHKARNRETRCELTLSYVDLTQDLERTPPETKESSVSFYRTVQRGCLKWNAYFFRRKPT